MTRAKPQPDTVLQQQLATCLEAMQDCLAHARAPKEDDEYGHQRRNDIAQLAKLMKASALLTAAMGGGEKRLAITVTRTGVDKG